MNLTALQTLYDFETPTEQALCVAFATAALSCYTPSNDALLADPNFTAANAALLQYILPVLDFQKSRPRVELEAMTGAAGLIHYPLAGVKPVGGYSHDMAHGIGVKVRCITEASIVIHRQYVLQVRAIMSTVLATVNGFAPMTNHCLQELNDGGNTDRYAPEQGLFETALIFNGQITMQADAVQAAL
jgi:hypothetical protein